MKSAVSQHVGCVPECCQPVFVYAAGGGGCHLRWLECTFVHNSAARVEVPDGIYGNSLERFSLFLLPAY